MAYEMRSMSSEKARTTMTVMNDPQGDVTNRARRVDQEAGDGSSKNRDEAVLARFGKKQQLKRRFKYLSSIAFNTSIMLTWEVVLAGIQFGLTNGGPAGLIYGFFAAWFGSFMQALVIAELASMIPLAGGAFNWVAILSPKPCRKFLSYLTGWLTVIAWQVFMADVVYVSASILQGLIITLYPEYNPQLWHATFIFYAILALALFMNAFLGRLLPRIESLCLIFYLIGFFGIIIPLIYLAPERRSTAEVFGTWQNLGGWSTMSLSFFVGWVSSTSAFIGLDGADHIAEEIDNAASVIPASVWFSVLMNGGLGLGIMLTVLYVTPDFVAATQSPTGFPFIDIFQYNLGIDAGTGLVIVFIGVNILSANSLLATASRSLWAFARENGLPYSKFLVKVDPKSRLPINANLVSIGINVVIAVISIGSTAAYEAFFSVSLAAYYSSFLIAACVMLYRRLTSADSELPWGPFRLGKFGVPITIIAIAYTLISVFFSFFPVTTPPTAANMNYSSLLFGAAMLFCVGFWFVSGRKKYVGPLWEFDGEFARLN